jgi:hypothetical protein
MRLRFVAKQPDGGNVIARFTDPMVAFAIAETLEVPCPPPPAPWPEPIDQLDLMICPASPGNAGALAGWLDPPDVADVPRAISVALPDARLSWRPGRALLQGAALTGQMLTAFAEFTFYEGQLRKLEQAVRPIEASAQLDAPEAYRIRSDTETYRARFGQKMEALALLRLEFARLEPRLLSAPRHVDAAAQKLFRRLLRQAGIEDRLSAISDRLEACEDLYEGAVDRITDYRWYRKGNLLEIIIIVLLLIEVLQLGADMALRWIAQHAR